MYFEQKVIDEKLHWRNQPEGDFTPYTLEQLTERVLQLQKYVSAIQETVLTLNKTV